MTRSKQGVIIAIVASAVPLLAQAPAQPPAPTTVAGCVTQVPEVADVYVIASGDRCLLLRGDFEAKKLLNHEVVLNGLLLDASDFLPARVQVQSTKSIGVSCSRVCTQTIPGSRGVHGNEKPGVNGGTAGAVPTKPAATAPPH